MISLIAAIGKNRELGKDNKLLWHIPEDLKRFKEITKGHPIIMGRKTFESIGRVLPGRLNVIVTRDSQYPSHSELVSESLGRSRNKFGMTDCIVVSSLEKAIEEAEKWLATKDKELTTNEDEIFVIGGGQVFEQALPLADKLYLTIVDADFDADTFFPEYKKIFRKETFREEGKSDGHSYIFVNLEK